MGGQETKIRAQPAARPRGSGRHNRAPRHGQTPRREPRQRACLSARAPLPEPSGPFVGPGMNIKDNNVCDGITINPMSMGIPATWSARINALPPTKAKGGGVAMTCNNCRGFR